MAKHYTQVPHEFLDEMDELTDEEFGRLMRFMMTYDIGGETPDVDLDGNERFFAKYCINMVDRFKKVSESRTKSRKPNQKSLKDDNNFVEQKITNDNKTEQKITKNNKTKQNETKNNKTEQKITNDNKTEQKENEKEQEKRTKKEEEKENIYINANARAGAQKRKYADYVTLSEPEYDKLCQKYGETDAKAMIEILNNYKGSVGKTYKSDYLAILNWVVAENAKRKMQNKARGMPKNKGFSAFPQRDYDFEKLEQDLLRR